MGTTGTPLLSLDYRCGCGKRPNWRFHATERERYRDVPDDTPVATWVCQGCGQPHTLNAAAWKRARVRAA